MSFTPSLNVVVLGTGDVASRHLDALKAVRAAEELVTADGQKIMFSIGLWAPEREHKALRVLASEQSIGLYGHDPEDLIQAPDIHAVVACLEDPNEQRIALLRAVATATHGLAVPPLAASADDVAQLVQVAESKGVITGISEDDDPDEAVADFLRAILTKTPAAYPWREWLEFNS